MEFGRVLFRSRVPVDSPTGNSALSFPTAPTPGFRIMLQMEVVIGRIVLERLKIDVVIWAKPFAHIPRPLLSLGNADVASSQINALSFWLQAAASMLAIARSCDTEIGRASGRDRGCQ